MEDKILIDKIINHDHQAFKELVDKYSSLVINTCKSFVHDLDDAQDIAQDVFIEIYQSIHKFREEAKISTWLYRISVNKSLNFIRKRKKNILFKSIEQFFLNSEKEEIDILASNSQNADAEIDNEERKKILYKAIESLTYNQKIAFTLNKFEDISYKEIAEIMDLSLSSVESLIHRAKINLQKKLINYYKKNIY
ncbi:MAG: sigma-70 family RNA polymerase sigma factor [Bacteroidetes bacterium]|nr:sigma-70 family RNA polymerase sigma factor [Bacteroidota bacterium]